jgi:hypothetical protein
MTDLSPLLSTTSIGFHPGALYVESDAITPIYRNSSSHKSSWPIFIPSSSIKSGTQGFGFYQAI